MHNADEAAAVETILERVKPDRHLLVCDESQGASPDFILVGKSGQRFLVEIVPKELLVEICISWGRLLHLEPDRGHIHYEFADTGPPLLVISCENRATAARFAQWYGT